MRIGMIVTQETLCRNPLRRHFPQSRRQQAEEPLSFKVLMKQRIKKQKSSRNEVRYDYSIWQVAPI
jgi:hypothetical protein